MDCEVCCEKLNASNRKRVTCCTASCTFKVCRVCAMHYLLNNTANPHCMACKIGWNREFMDQMFTKKFLTTEYKTHRENVLLEREKSMLPDSIPLAEAVKPMYDVKKAASERLKVVTSELASLQDQLVQLRINIPFKNAILEIAAYAEFNDRLLVLNAEKAAKEVASNTLITRIKFVDTFIKDPVAAFHRYNSDNKVAQPKRAFIRGCPAPECRGFLSTQWMCGLCNVKVCKDCHEIKTVDNEEEHTCKKENLETVALMAKDTRHCPKCAANIFKIDGCDQMWCTQCHTAFSWRTGNIETSVHNPHYYEYLRQNGQAVPRAVGDNPCGGADGIIDLHTVFASFKRFMSTHTEYIKNTYDNVTSYHRLYRHIQHVELPRFVTNAVIDNQDLRIKYLIKEIDENNFKAQLQQREKKNEKKRDIHNLLSLHQLVTVDIFNNIRIDNSVAQWRKAHTELDNLRAYVNTCMMRISKRYSNCVVPIINFDDIHYIITSYP